LRRPSVTQLVDFSKCEKLAILKRSRAETLDSTRRAAVERGEREHLRLERQGVVDGRCFVASFAYGSDAEQVHALRAWRDKSLKPTKFGRVAIAIYYAASPWAVRALSKIPKGQKLARHAVDWALRRISR
jgi:diacylglycerol kinase family enzyme